VDYPGLGANASPRHPATVGDYADGDVGVEAAFAAGGSWTMKGSQKPKKTGKKPAQKTLKERRVEKRAAAKQPRSLDV